MLSVLRGHHRDGAYGESATKCACPYSELKGSLEICDNSLIDQLPGELDELPMHRVRLHVVVPVLG